MSKSITQDMRYRQSLMQYAAKYGVSRASRKYNKSRSYIYFWKARWNGSVASLACQSRRPHHHSNQHTEVELKLIRDMRRRNPTLGMLEFWHRLRKRGYTRRPETLFRVMRKLGMFPQPKAKAPYKAKPYEQMQYSKDGINYGVPFHVGACVMFYNTEILEEAGIDYTTIDTWDEFIEAGLIVKEKTGKYMTTAEGTRVNMLSAFLGEQGGDFVDENGVPNIVTEEMYNALEMEKRMIDLGISRVSPGGKPDSEECYGWINSGEVASLAFPLWFMSRFVDYMPDVAGKIAIAPMPRFEEGQDRSAGVGGTATVVINTAHDKDLAKEFVAWAKLSVEGGTKIWEILGFDPVNTKVWDDPAVTNDPDNKYLQYFVTNPFDTLREIRDEVNIIRSVEATPTISNYFNNQILLDVFENDADIMTTLENAQEEIMNQLS